MEILVPSLLLILYVIGGTLTGAWVEEEIPHINSTMLSVCVLCWPITLVLMTFRKFWESLI